MRPPSEAYSEYAAARGRLADDADGPLSPIRACEVNEVGVEGGSSADVGGAIAGEDVDAASAGMEAMPPDALDDHDAGPGRVRDLHREQRAAPVVEHAGLVAVGQSARPGVLLGHHHHRRLLTASQQLRLTERRVEEESVRR